MRFTRSWAMPNSETFDVEPMGLLVKRLLSDSKVSVDPFARNKRWATHTNDINPNTEAEHHKDAVDFLSDLSNQGVVADLIIFDPPYSPRQVSECYAEAGLTPTMRDTQTGRSKKQWRDGIRAISDVGTVVASFGWNSVGMGSGWTTEEILIVCHGGDHNDTICLVERMTEKQEEMFGEAA